MTVQAARTWETYEILGPTTAKPSAVAVTLGATAVQLDDGAGGRPSAMPGRRKVRVYNLDAAITVFVGWDANVTNAGGAEPGTPISPGYFDEFQIGEQVAIFAVAASGAPKAVFYQEAWA